MRIEIVGNERDRADNELIIKHSDLLSYTPAYSFFLKEMANLIDSGNHIGYTYWDDKNCGIIWAENVDNKVVGILVYDRSFTKSRIPCLYIVLTAVDINYRQLGIHIIMNKYFERQVQKLNCQGIKSEISLKNKIRLLTAERDQLVPYAFVVSKKIS